MNRKPIIPGEPFATFSIVSLSRMSFSGFNMSPNLLMTNVRRTSTHKAIKTLISVVWNATLKSRSSFLCQPVHRKTERDNPQRQQRMTMPNAETASRRNRENGRHKNRKQLIMPRTVSAEPALQSERQSPAPGRSTDVHGWP